MKMHTEGPWEAWLRDAKFGMTGVTAFAALEFRSSLRDMLSKGEVFVVQIASKKMDAPAVVFGKTREECEANARLIAASPDMYSYIQHQAESGDTAARNILDKVQGKKPD